MHNKCEYMLFLFENYRPLQSHEDKFFLIFATTAGPWLRKTWPSWGSDRKAIQQSHKKEVCIIFLIYYS